MVKTPVPMFNCPSRRSPIAYPHGSKKYWIYGNPGQAARTDYAANIGDYEGVEWLAGPSDTEIDMPDFSWPTWIRDVAKHHMELKTGITYGWAEIRLAQITDGTSNTYLFGEKYMDPNGYVVQSGGGDDQTMLCGLTDDICRGTHWNAATQTGAIPNQDTAGSQQGGSFGSAHSGAWNVVLCDGSVHSISYSIDGEMHRRLGNRKDGLPVEGVFQ
jgi:hypothetical protein